MSDQVFDAEAVRAFEHARWQRAAAVYGATFAAATRPFIEALLDEAQVAGGAQVLDVGCGPGFVCSAAKKRGATAYGLDFSPAMLAIARARENTVRFDEGDAQALPYPDASFDAVVASFCIHHVPRPALAVKEAFRVLRPCGRVAFSFWAEPSDNIAWKLVFDAVARHGNGSAARTPEPGGGFGTAEQCANVLRAAGFEGCLTRLVRAEWRHRDAEALIMALQAGTARMAAMLEAQGAEAKAAIVTDVADNAARYRTADGIAVPIAAIIASGGKP